MSVLSSLCHLSVLGQAIFLWTEEVVRSAREQHCSPPAAPCPSFSSCYESPKGKPSSLSQPQTLNALSLPFFRPRFAVGCGGGGVMLYLLHASFVRGIIINPFLVVGSVRQTSGLFLNMTFPSS